MYLIVSAVLALVIYSSKPKAPLQIKKLDMGGQYEIELTETETEKPTDLGNLPKKEEKIEEEENLLDN